MSSKNVKLTETKIYDISIYSAHVFNKISANIFYPTEYRYLNDFYKCIDLYW